jgi:hypothetical protein
MRAGSSKLGRRVGLRLPLLALLCLVFVSGQRCPASPPIRGPASPERISRDRLLDDYRAALHAVYTEIVAERPGGLPADVEDRLQRAAKVLRSRAESSRAAELARRIAIVRLTLEDLEIVREGTGPRPILKYEDAFLRPVGAPLRDIERHIVVELEKIEAQPMSLTPEQLIELLISILQNSLFHLLDVTFKSDPCGFPFKDLDTNTHTNNDAAPDVCHRADDSWKDGMVWVEARVKIQRPLADLAKLFDPQSWDEVGDCSPWFETACVTNPEKGGACDDCLHPPGSEWNAGFFEHFEWNEWPLGGSTGTTNATFLTYLDVDTAYSDPIDPDHYRVDYCLDHVQLAKIGDNPTGTIATDQGFTLISELEDGWVEIEAHKMIKFAGWHDAYGNSTDTAMNFDADVFLQGLGDGTLNLACCALPGAPTCPSP